jgi:serine/threonine protein phosphatase PrpC
VLPTDVFCEGCGAPQWAGQPGDGRSIDAGAAGAATDRGLVRDRNEDAVHVETIDGASIAIVCDGVASTVDAQRAAAVAAAVAGRVLGDAVRARAARWDPEHATTAAMDAADHAVTQIGLGLGAVDDAPACTYVSAVWDGSDVVVGSAGDSRAYWISGSSARQLTVDDSWAHDQLAANGLDADEISRDPNAHAITRWLGADAPPGSFTVSRLAPTNAGRIVLCSDGLWRYATEPEEMALLITSLPPSTAAADVARALVDAALAAGGQDNVTAAVLDVQPQPDPHSDEEEAP